MDKSIKYVIGSDHAGYELKTELIKNLHDHYFSVMDIGTHSEESVDYPEYGQTVAQIVNDYPDTTVGILICGTGIGMSIVANRFPNVRAALVTSTYTACMARKHNDANVIVFGSRTTMSTEASCLLNIFIDTAFDGERHQRRVDQINT